MITMMGTKTILFDGGPLNGQFKVVDIGTDRVALDVKIDTEISDNEIIALDPVKYKRVYYKKTSKKINGVEYFVYIDLNS